MSVPSMRHQIAITAILCDYEFLFWSLKPPPRESFFEAAKQSRNPFYLKYLEEFVKERSIGSNEISEFNPYDTTVEANSPGIYGGLPVQAGVVEKYMWLSTETAQKIKEDWWEYNGIYDGSADTDLLHSDDDDSDNELWLKLSRPPMRMTSFEMKEDAS
ncbi:hypothetical protein N7462_000290 [Penicillium macrosclerotiorum]|uniref:uncharacterized protein n=1 Tax=Penicillium macrosclerotiorum TaxID=303699 RepID=UPI002548F978|nr:uncharacterized protein N7462_000290 [Penicillium macrosclerotiorum]KAJ5698285.1 hypothetical protein N7462_000290 [Penicillium macrosclerotiorum]